MKITALVENTTKGDFKTTHGLSFYITTQSHKLLFDVGPDDTLFENAKNQGINLAEVDTVIISHGHGDHGGALGKFLEINSSAKVYIQRTAFDPHYIKVLFAKKSIGIDPALITHPQVVAIDGNCKIDHELFLFTQHDSRHCHSGANATLFCKDGPDNFEHEQNLIITEQSTALIMGCGHLGVVNIMEVAGRYAPDVCVGGYHLFNPATQKTVPTKLLDEIATRLVQYDKTRFYTCHCTGAKAFAHLSARMPNLHYIACGDEIEL